MNSSIEKHSKWFLFAFPMLLISIHSFLHIRQGKSYMSHENLLIPDIVLLLETGIHFLSYFYTYKVYNGDKTMMMTFAGMNVVSWILGIQLVMEGYFPGSFHEHLSYFLTSAMGAHCAAMLFNSPRFGFGYFGFSYGYLAFWIPLLSSYQEFVKYNHFMELLLTTCFTVMTVQHVYDVISAEFKEKEA